MRTVESDEDYYRRRAAMERDAATAAVDERARQVHSELADRYAERAGGTPARPVVAD